MELIKYKVNKFRSVKGTEWIDIDHWACFVGVNEAGKTNLLLPLWKFNPADNATKIDLLADYPRDEYSEISGSDDELLNHEFIEVVFKVSDIEKKETSKLYNKYLSSKFDPAEQDGENLPEIKPEVKFSDFLTISRDYNGNYRVYISDERGQRASNDLDNIVGEDAFKYILGQIPKFVYYSEYGNLDSDIYLPRAIEDLSRIDQLSQKERLKARTLRILFSHLNLKPEEVQNLGRDLQPNNPKSDTIIEQESRNRTERYAKISSAESRLTRQFKEWWSQGNYTFHFNADGDFFRIFVSDSERPDKIELEARSKGLQWFFSFFLVFLAESEENHKNCVLLLDEPGLSLHPNAQKDLIKFFNQISEKNQVIYTTHLPFLVDHNNLDKIKAVYTEAGLTKISNDLSKADKEKKAIQPVNAAIGITASQSLLIGCDIVIVEGESDVFYMNMMKNYLVSTGKYTPKKEMVFIPVGGASGVKPVVSIITGATTNLPFVVLDADSTGLTFKKGLEQGLYSSQKELVMDLSNFTDTPSAEIEDLIPVDLLVWAFNRQYRLEEELESENINGGQAIIPQLKELLEKNSLLPDIGWKVELSKRVKQKFSKIDDSGLEDKWLKLFNALKSK